MRRRLYLAWNLLGLVDIICCRHGRSFWYRQSGFDEATIRFAAQPAAAFLVPLIITSHLLLISRLRHPLRELASIDADA